MWLIVSEDLVHHVGEVAGMWVLTSWQPRKQRERKRAETRQHWTPVAHFFPIVPPSIQNTNVWGPFQTQATPGSEWERVMGPVEISSIG